MLRRIKNLTDLTRNDMWHICERWGSALSSRSTDQPGHWLAPEPRTLHDLHRSQLAAAASYMFLVLFLAQLSYTDFDASSQQYNASTPTTSEE
jgi:hypothetical protein